MGLQRLRARGERLSEPVAHAMKNGEKGQQIMMHWVGVIGQNGREKEALPSRGRLRLFKDDTRAGL